MWCGERVQAVSRGQRIHHSDCHTSKLGPNGPRLEGEQIRLLTKE